MIVHPLLHPGAVDCESCQIRPAEVEARLPASCRLLAYDAFLVCRECLPEVEALELELV